MVASQKFLDFVSVGHLYALRGQRGLVSTQTGSRKEQYLLTVAAS
jgi:hypothetical protein